MDTLLNRINRIDQRFLILCICAVFFIIVGSQICAYSTNQYDYEAVEKATVEEVLSTTTDTILEGYESTTVTFTAKLTSGEGKGEVVDMTQYIDSMYLPIPDEVEPGDTILAIQAQEGTGDAQWSYAGVNRISGMIKLVAVFFLLILLIGGTKGGATIVSLLLSVAVIFLVYIPSILTGWNVYFTTIVVVTYIILVSLLLLNGFNTKTLCAIVGNLAGTLVAGLMALFVNSALYITGVIDQDYVFLTMLEGDVSIDLKAVVWGGILIGSLGAIMDVSMSIASAMQELAREMQVKSMPKLVYSGMQIGKDMIGTMTNTLILAYVGGSLAVVLLFAAYSKNLYVVMNLEMIAIEVIQAVVGSMGILVAVPLTVFFSAWKFLHEEAVVTATPVQPKPQPQSRPQQEASQPAKAKAKANPLAALQGAVQAKLQPKAKRSRHTKDDQQPSDDFE